MSDPSPLKIILSYRRGDSADVAGRICDRLKQHFGQNRVFIDIDSIPAGVDFPDHLQRELAGCGALVAIIGKHWTGQRRGSQARIMDEDDWVRLEVETALARQVPVIPALVGGASLPSQRQLPESLGGLLRLNALPIDSGRDFHMHMNRLIEALGRMLGESEAAGAGPAGIATFAELGAGKAPPRRGRMPALPVPSYLTDSAPIAAGLLVLASLAFLGWPAAETLLRGGDPAEMGWFDKVIAMVSMPVTARVFIAAMFAAVAALLWLREAPIEGRTYLALKLGSGVALVAAAYLYFYTGPSFYEDDFAGFPTVSDALVPVLMEGGDYEGAKAAMYAPLRAWIYLNLVWNALVLAALIKNKVRARSAIPATAQSNG